jgi:hypothetical protein
VSTGKEEISQKKRRYSKDPQMSLQGQESISEMSETPQLRAGIG